MNKPLPMRLAFRHEGMEWVAYCAKPDTMDHAIKIGSIAYNIVVEDNNVKNAFMEVMKLAIVSLTKAILEVDNLAWTDPQPAPEHEKSGHG